MKKKILSDLEKIKLDEAKLYSAKQSNIMKRLSGKVISNIAKACSVAILGTAALGALDLYVLNTGTAFSAINDVSDKIGYFLEDDPETEIENPRILENTYLTDILSGGILAFAAGTLGILGINKAVSKKYRDQNTIAEAVLSVPHKDVNSEKEMYENLTGKDASKWKKERKRYFNTLSEWAKVETISACLYDDNFHLGNDVPEEMLSRKPYHRPNLEEILEGLSKQDGRGPFILPKRNVARVAFSLPKQPNQAQSYFEGFIFEDLETTEFQGYEIVLKKLSSGEWVIGTYGPDKVKLPGIFSRKKSSVYEKMIKEEALKLLYYNEASEDELTIGLVSEGTYPVSRGGVASLVNEMIEELIPDYFNKQKVHWEVISHLALIGPYNTKISYKIPDNAHVNPPIIIYGYTMNPSFDEKKKLPKTGVPDDTFGQTYDRMTGSKEEIRKNGIKRTLSQLETSIKTCNINLFYKTAEMMQFFSADELMISPAALEFLYEKYHEIDEPDKPDFSSFQYQWRNLRQPLIYVVKSEKVKADVYYSVVTGTSGVYAALAKREHGSGIVLTEHGIYKEDRLVDIANSPFTPFLAKRWEETLDFYSRLSYDAAHTITTTCTSNRYKQLRDGADESKLRFIPGAVHIKGGIPKYDHFGLKDPDYFEVGMLGNVQRVKRAELFINTADLMIRNHPEINWKFRIMGRDDPYDPRYVDQIHTLVDNNPVLKNSFEFSPYTNYKEAFGPLDCGVLMSSSEVQPRSVMEFLSLGKPMLALDVGGIDELINGTGVDEYGPAGIVVGVGTNDNVVKGMSDAILTMYLRKHYMLTGKNSSIIPPDKNTLSNLISQKIPMEEVGPKRMAESYDMDLIMPLYAKEYLASIENRIFENNMKNISGLVV
ncbi:MAG: GT4 family glycosyltransferase PelF [Candidatus Woesearchaeota archaeon]